MSAERGRATPGRHGAREVVGIQVDVAEARHLAGMAQIGSELAIGLHAGYEKHKRALIGAIEPILAQKNRQKLLFRKAVTAPQGIDQRIGGDSRGDGEEPAGGYRLRRPRYQHGQIDIRNRQRRPA